MFFDHVIHLSSQVREALKDEWKTASVVRLCRDETAYICGQHDQNIYLVEEGCIKTIAYSREGKRCLLSVYTAGDMLGELGMLPVPRCETASAVRHSVLRQMPAPKFRALLRSSAIIDEYLMHLVGRSFEQQQMIINFVTLNSEQRLAALLLVLARKLGTRDGARLLVHVRLTHEDLSAMVGTTRSRVGLFLKRFRTRGLLSSYAGGPMVIDEHKLTEFVADHS